MTHDEDSQETPVAPSRPTAQREVVKGPVDLEAIARRQREGWRIRSIEWEREGAPSRVLARAEVPYGLRPVEGSLGKELEDDPAEIEVLLEALVGITQDRPLSEIAERLNQRFSYQRNGSPWDQVALFELLPRLIEVSPDLLSSEQWPAFRQQRRAGALHSVAS